MKNENIGIIGLGTYTPSEFLSSQDIADKTGIPEDVIRLKFGVDKKPVPGPGDTTSFMGIEAARESLAMAGIDPEEIDVLIWNGAQHKDYLNWLAGLHVAKEIGAVNAWSFDMEAMCGSMMAGMEVARSLMVANPEYKTVMLVSGYRNGDMVDYGVKETSFMFDLGAGGAAMILRKGHNANILTASAFRGDGDFSTDCIVKAGGTKNWPMKAEDTDKLHFEIDDVDSFKQKLGERTLPNFFAVIDDSLKKSGLERKDLDYLAILHFKKSTHDYILKELGLNEDQTTYLNEYGHIGQNDQVISLLEGLKSGKVKDGDNIVMVGAGIGFVWAACAVKWGPVSG
ncbi:MULTISPECIES: 3-oxoacyl-ACP synthase [unclassified Oceanispirochaeta]|uniref:3-oxoacyl-ACP synthase n=1 Tax=unclassified Oceanispirochaeta TaxID=2635722 RepID=UPI000E08D432|nr:MULTISPECIES: 3-oxoacyl-ACP synthase [unclassified Oceanispirochaeta]MBF9018152.1 3-oxoacyl-ACP synthase [Oceanispirochaeta sp. M2]NPD74616.1 3-oxoacyl-ACP synthase [Oceanispirochaeta sp. M1]RDG29567.1 3-oxoacyl-ACP synthase [Oceanispirochaeta sp. M1]